MSGWILSLRQRPPCTVDASPLVPTALAGKTADEVRRLPLAGWNLRTEVGELFGVAPATGGLRLEGLEGSFVRVAAGLATGEVTVAGHAGDYAGERLAGGSLRIEGDAGDLLGANMRSGTIEVAGAAGNFAGSGRAGEMHGMTGGTLIIRGNVGDRTGDRMRRGLLLVEGDTGAYPASRMVAGSMVVLGRLGYSAGYLMRRGTLLGGALGGEMLPTFNSNGSPDLLATRLLLRSLTSHGERFRAWAESPPAFERWLGDLAASGQGEILVRA